MGGRIFLIFNFQYLNFLRTFAPVQWNEGLQREPLLIMISLAHTTRLTREGPLVGFAGVDAVGALSRNHHRTLHITEVVALDESI